MAEVDDVEQKLNRPTDEQAFTRWLSLLETRHLADLTFAQVSSALRALSSIYVERRQRVREGAALDGTGKRAAFALFYGPLHYMLVREIVHSLAERDPASGPLASRARTMRLMDLGCGTGAAGAAWGAACGRTPDVLAFDRHPWALVEAAETYRAFGLNARTRRADVLQASLPADPALILGAFVMNELDATARDTLLQRLVERTRRGDRLLVVEPIATSAAPWWRTWRTRVEEAGGRADEWRFRVELPPIVAKLDRAAGLNHRELTGRSLWLSGTR